MRGRKRGDGSHIAEYFKSVAKGASCIQKLHLEPGEEGASHHCGIIEEGANQVDSLREEVAIKDNSHSTHGCDITPLVIVVRVLCTTSFPRNAPRVSRNQS